MSTSAPSASAISAHVDMVLDSPTSRPVEATFLFPLPKARRSTSWRCG